jgi:hypothetical protein
MVNKRLLVRDFNTLFFCWSFTDFNFLFQSGVPLKAADFWWILWLIVNALKSLANNVLNGSAFDERRIGWTFFSLHNHDTVVIFVIVDLCSFDVGSHHEEPKQEEDGSEGDVGGSEEAHPPEQQAEYIHAVANVQPGKLMCHPNSGPETIK